MPGTQLTRRLLTLALFTGFLTAVPVRADEPKVGDLRRGLVATYRDGTKTEIQRLEPTVALRLSAGESAHPRLDGKSETVTWKGYLNVVRGGNYRFRVRLLGEFKLSIGGKEVMSLKAAAEKAALTEGVEVRLEPGVQPLVAEFTRTAAAARVELLWQSMEFPAEPLHQDFLGHTAAQETDAFKTNVRIEEGRFLAEEMNCVKCHRGDDNKVAKTLDSHVGPDLSNIGKRTHAGWIQHWLESPQKLRPTAVMPEMFAHDDLARIERHAVASYLASLGGPVQPKETPKRDGNSIARGVKLFTSAGCLACHGAYGVRSFEKKTEESARIYGTPRIHPLSRLGSKTTADRLAEYLSNPLAHDPSGRMPNMVLQGSEALDLAHYLCDDTDADISRERAIPSNAEQIDDVFKRLDKLPEELAAFKKLSAADQWKDLGKRLVIDKGCNNCHKIEPGGKPFAQMNASADLGELLKADKQQSGCLAEKADKRGKAPVFTLTDADRAALRTFLNEGLKGAGTTAPGYTARVEIRRFNCLACHNRDGEGGLSTALTDQLRKYENAENAEAVSPPTLTGVAHKLRTPWMRDVLTKAARARPWMGLRMPQFGEANVGKLPDMLASLEGTDTEDALRKVEITTAKTEAGRKLVGKTAFGCISCHDIAGIPNSGTRGPDLAGMNQRVRYEWYQRWLEQPQRMQPGTRMPSVFSEGKSLLPNVLDGSAEHQADAMWAYLSLGPTLPLPVGLEPPKGMILYVTDRPTILRTFMPDNGGTRAIAVGYPGGVSTSFDAHTCRLTYAWSGQFLDARPVWDGRGGNPAKLMGAKFWTAPPGCPIAASTSSEPPDFLSRAADPAYGGALPEGKAFLGTSLLNFEGYGLDDKGVPTFRYRLTVGDKEEVKVSEAAEPLRAPAGVGVGRRFTLQVPAKQTAWVLVAESEKTPQLLNDKGEKQPLDVKDGVAEMTAKGRTLLVALGGDRVALVSPMSLPDGSQWRVQQVDKKWQVLLRTPMTDKATTQHIDVNIWVPHRDEMGMLKELLTQQK